MAAIATNAMMGVVEPMMNGIGGDLFAIVYDAKAKKLYGLNASGWAPKGLTIGFLQKQGLREMPQAGINSVTVPGMVDGWQKLSEKFGRKETGGGPERGDCDWRGTVFRCRKWMRRIGVLAVDLLRSNEAASKLYLPGDRAPKVGEIFKNEDLAWSLETDRRAWQGCVLPRRDRAKNMAAERCTAAPW